MKNRVLSCSSELRYKTYIIIVTGQPEHMKVAKIRFSIQLGFKMYISHVIVRNAGKGLIDDSIDLVGRNK